MNAVQKLRQIVGEIRARPDGAQANSNWELAGRLLGRMPLDTDEAARVCVERDIERLDEMVGELENPGAKAAGAGAEPAASGAETLRVSTEEMDRALRAFRKRLKVMRLADESKLGGRRVTGGRKSEIDAIMPPHEFSGEVWRALAKAGRLKDVGNGFYALPE